jgi:predicted Zn-dependent peptidase
MPSTQKTKSKPAAKKTPQYTLPPALEALAASVIEAKLPNGLQVRLLPSDAVPTCSFYTFFRVGARNERPGITGISHLFEHMMFNGAKKYGPGQFDRVLESNGGTSNAYTSNDLTVYYEDFMSEALEKVIDLESDRMRSLQVTPKMLESERKVVMEERRLRVDNEIGGLMDEELSSLVWKAHPYRWPVIGWMKDIENIRREDCLEYFQTFYALLKPMEGEMVAKKVVEKGQEVKEQDDEDEEADEGLGEQDYTHVLICIYNMESRYAFLEAFIHVCLVV